MTSEIALTSINFIQGGTSVPIGSATVGEQDELAERLAKLKSKT